mmetsp:Transcript_41661/g.120694  ORF Transcript_41661/g.120694 Transcript_41661/m.120694 type:complete len:222 (-) Transcript_41661:967-1632(-)
MRPRVASCLRREQTSGHASLGVPALSSTASSCSPLASPPPGPVSGLAAELLQSAPSARAAASLTEMQPFSPAAPAASCSSLSASMWPSPSSSGSPSLFSEPSPTLAPSLCSIMCSACELKRQWRSTNPLLCPLAGTSASTEGSTTATLISGVMGCTCSGGAAGRVGMRRRTKSALRSARAVPTKPQAWEPAAGCAAAAADSFSAALARRRRAAAREEQMPA